MRRSAHPGSKLHSVFLYAPMVERGEGTGRVETRSRRQVKLTLKLELFPRRNPLLLGLSSRVGRRPWPLLNHLPKSTCESLNWRVGSLQLLDSFH